MSKSSWALADRTKAHLARSGAVVTAVLMVAIAGGCGASSPKPSSTPGRSASASPTATPWASPSATPSARPASGTFTDAGPILGDSALMAPALLPDGRVFFMTGPNWGSLKPGTAELYDPAQGVFSLGPSGLYMRDYGINAVALLDGRLLIVGGGVNPNVAELYDPATGTFAETGAALGGMCCSGAVQLRTGDVLINSDSSDGRVQLYDPATGKFRWSGAMRTKAFARTMTLLADGRVLFTGGATGSGMAGNLAVYAQAEIYDPATGKFTATGSMKQKLTGHAAALLADGRVLIVGGNWDGGYADRAEIWDPATGEFTLTGATVAHRTGATAITLQDGRVLILGGSNAEGAPPFAELYDPAAGQFTLTGSIVGPEAPSATLLPDGRVLIVGFGSYPYAELYWP